MEDLSKVTQEVRAPRQLFSPCPCSLASPALKKQTWGKQKRKTWENVRRPLGSLLVGGTSTREQSAESERGGFPGTNSSHFPFAKGLPRPHTQRHGRGQDCDLWAPCSRSPWCPLIAAEASLFFWPLAQGRCHMARLAGEELRGSQQRVSETRTCSL